MTFPEAIRTCFRRTLDFRGRASRSEFWLFYAFCFLGSGILPVIEGQIFGPYSLTTSEISQVDGKYENVDTTIQWPGPQWLTFAFSLIVFLPLLSASVRRLHDTSRSGIWVLGPYVLMFGPLIYIFWPFVQGWWNGTGVPDLDVMDLWLRDFPWGWFLAGWFLGFVLCIVLFVFLVKASMPGANRYGDGPGIDSEQARGI